MPNKCRSSSQRLCIYHWRNVGKHPGSSVNPAHSSHHFVWIVLYNGCCNANAMQHCISRVSTFCWYTTSFMFSSRDLSGQCCGPPWKIHQPGNRRSNTLSLQDWNGETLRWAQNVYAIVFRKVHFPTGPIVHSVKTADKCHTQDNAWW